MPVCPVLRCIPAHGANGAPTRPARSRPDPYLHCPQQQPVCELAVCLSATPRRFSCLSVVFLMPENPRFAPNADFSTAVWRSSAESLVVRKRQMRKLAYSDAGRRGVARTARRTGLPNNPEMHKPAECIAMRRLGTFLSCGKKVKRGEFLHENDLSAYSYVFL